MEKGAFVKDIKEGCQIAGIFLLEAATQGMTQSGKPYWNVGLVDRTGRIEGRIWSPECERHERIEPGSLAAIQGRGTSFRDRIQVAIDKFTPLGDAAGLDIDLADFVPVSSVAPAEMLADLRALCELEFRHSPWRDLVFSILDDPAISRKLLLAPAARRIHQAYAGGLLEHTLNVAGLCLAIASRYPFLDRQALLAGAVLHDLGKIREFGGLFNEYTSEGSLAGHIVIGIEIITPFLAASRLEPPLQEHLRHLIISHHGEREYGSPCLPQTAEAFALHYADNLDAKLSLCRDLFGEECSRPCWSERVWSLERKILLPERTPQEPPGAGQAGEEELAQEAPGEVDGQMWQEYADEADRIDRKKPDGNKQKEQGSLW